MSERLRHPLLIILIILSSLFFIPFIPPSLSQSPSDIGLYLTSLTGLIGTVFMVWEFLLGTRTISAFLLQDLPWAMRVHTFLGIYGILLVFIHPLVSLLSFGENLLYIFLPNLKTGYEQTITWGRLGLVLLLVIWITSALIRGRIKYRPWKYIHYLSYLILPATFLHSQSIGTTLLLSKPALTYWYVLIAVYVFVCLMRLRFFFGFGKTPYRIVGSSNRGDIHKLTLEPLQPPRPINNGQYLYIQPTLLSEEHPFSAWNFDAQGKISIVYKQVGKFTRTLSGLPVGKIVYVDGPYGVFTSEAATSPGSPAVFISAGVGITPFYKTLTETATGQDRYFFDCNNQASGSLITPREQARLGGRYVSVLSADPTAAGPTIEHGRMSQTILKKYLNQPENYHYYVCGSVTMLKATHTVLRQMGIPQARIKMEKFSL